MPNNRPEFIPTRQSLLERLKDLRDQASWQDFYNAYGRLIYTTACKAGLTEEEAQDAVQETVIAVARNLPGFKYDPAVCSFKSWLLLITRQRIVWQLRLRGKMRRVPQHPAEATTRTAGIDRIPDPASLDLDLFWEREWQNNLLSAALERVKKQVSARQFQIFDLYAVQHWPVHEVTRTLRVSSAQVYLSRHRVGALLRKEVKRLEAQDR
jgi:RNA polymerase sigma-70 factor (ECF subfamily)